MTSFTSQYLRKIRSDKSALLAHRRARGYRHRITTVYDISTTCNLFCEGCLYFCHDGSTGQPKSARTDIDAFRNLFVVEKKRGVSYPVFGGAEPSLRIDLLELATEFWNEGMVHTNGIRKIPEQIPYRLLVSCWGHRENTTKWRGADCYEKMLSNVENDKRAIINYTISSKNLDDIELVVRDCAARNIPITFQIYSPTEETLEIQSSQTRHSEMPFLRGAASNDFLALDKRDNQRAKEIVNQVSRDYPQVVVFNRALSNWIFSRDTILDADGEITCEACPLAKISTHKHFTAPGIEETKKRCGHPQISCANCRLYTVMYQSYFELTRKKPNVSEADIQDYFDVHSVFERVFCYSSRARP